MAKGLLINLDRCSGCDSCIVACKLENGLDLGALLQQGPLHRAAVGTFPNVEKYWLALAVPAVHVTPQCVAVCPTARKSYRDPKTGYVLIDKEKCIGCQVIACMPAPTAFASFDKEHGCVEKCTLVQPDHR